MTKSKAALQAAAQEAGRAAAAAGQPQKDAADDQKTKVRSHLQALPQLPADAPAQAGPYTKTSPGQLEPFVPQTTQLIFCNVHRAPRHSHGEH